MYLKDLQMLMSAELVGMRGCQQLNTAETFSVILNYTLLFPSFQTGRCGILVRHNVNTYSVWSFTFK